MNKVLIKRIDKNIPLPKYETQGSVAFDFVTRLDTIIPAKELALIPSNVIVKVPEGYMLCLASRSSTPLKRRLLTPHGFGVIDLDYHGPNDEIKVMVFNFSDQEVTIEKGARIAQGIFIKIDKFEFEEVEQIDAQDRGGFGSTGTNI